MKKLIRINENELKKIISKSVKKILKEEIDYRSVSDWNNELSNTDNLYDYDETLRNAKENLRMQGVSASLHHPATTPWASDDPDELGSMDSLEVLYAKPDELERWADKRKTQVYPSGLEESIRNSIKRVLREWNKMPDFIIRSISVNNNDVSNDFFNSFGDTFKNKYDFSSKLNAFLEKFGIQAYDVDTANDFGEEGDEIYINTNSEDIIEVHGGYEDLIGSQDVIEL